MSSNEARLARLSKFFNNVIYNQRILTSSREGCNFIESVCAQADPAACLHKLLSKSSGLIAIQACVRFDTSPSNINENTVLLLEYLQSPALEAIDSGTALGKILLTLVEPPFFWDAFTEAFRAGLLKANACQSYAWLLLRLIYLPGKASAPYLTFVAKYPDVIDAILKSSEGDTRNLGQKIKHALSLELQDLHIDAEVKPGGRHDNDHADHRLISIMPTADELLSRERPFLRTADFLDDPIHESSRQSMHKDNQFRLLREDMLGEIREELKKLTGTKTGTHKSIVVDDLRLAGVEMGVERKRLPWGIKLQCRKELPHMTRIAPEKRKAYLMDHRHILRNGNMACLLLDDEPVAFPTIHRNEEEISKTPATIVVQLQEDSNLPVTLSKIKRANNIKLVQLDSAVFAFEPFLKRLQEIREVPLSDELLYWKEGDILKSPSFYPSLVTEALKRRPGQDIQSLLNTKTSIILDDTQLHSLCASLSQRVSLVQGPPGTGKSFIGALVAKVLHDSTSQVMLVVCFTNHALDQFLEDLMNIRIPSSHMVRLGGKSTARTKPLMIREQTGSKYSPTQWGQINKVEGRLVEHEKRLSNVFGRYQSLNIQKHHLLDYLEFATETLPFFDAFSVPTRNDGMTQVGRGNKAIGPFYLLDRWIRGMPDSGVLRHAQPPGAVAVWRMNPEARQSSLRRWREAILDELVEEIYHVGQDFNADQREVDRIMSLRDANIIREKRIIACTTNGAAKYAEAVQSAKPGIVLVEEAGEILEAHILTAIGPQTEQLILIGDHLQLRPKCSYELSVEGGNGYNLNQSLFERLVRKGVPHITLQKQYRMRPEISSLVRHLTYPKLVDAEKTLHRDDLRGFRDVVMFIDHAEPEIEQIQIRELRDMGSKSSKQNYFEAQMILKCVRYLAQQGYGSDKIVVLTPYLGQLKLLRDRLSKENDPILNDLDKFDLVRAGLLTDLSSKTTKPSLRISTIDNYQGEESNIVLVSMTRSNSSHDIGFMAAPERLNVLLSRARDALIMIGNSETFINARKGKEVWRNFFDHLKRHGHVYEGFPVKCEKHPDRIETLSKPEDFDMKTPDGGCKEPCGVLLKCGVHKCPSSCHQIFDHSKVKCTAILTKKCPQNHTQSWECHSGTSGPLACLKCEKDKREADKKARKALEVQHKRDAQIQKHQKEIAKIQEEIDSITQGMKDLRVDIEQETILAQKKKDLIAAKEMASRTKLAVSQAMFDTSNGPSPSNGTSTKKSKPQGTSKTTERKGNLQKHLKDCINHNESPSKIEWQRQKDQENATNPAIDQIMEMIGLEDVKSQVLKIKSKVEIALRQGTDLKKERLGLVLLGNPGTGKTTVARHYAKVLTSLDVLSGDGFVETTGSRLAYGGVMEVKDHLKTLENSDGGVYFIDEAYQLADGHNFGGKTVLDYLLAEIENLTGKVVFVFAGYRKQMEGFFEHNPGFTSRIPCTLHFADYEDPELLQMLQYNIDNYYSSTMDVEGGKGGLYMRIAVRRLGRGRGRDGFGNARALENLFARIRERQSDRITRERREGLSPDDYTMTKEDIIGPDPSLAITHCPAWESLQKLTGLKSVKDSVRFLIDNIQTNYKRELQEKNLIDVSLNRVFLGSPGTGKTTVAKLYGRILADLGLLSNGEVVTKNPADFIGSVIGQSEANTKAILATTVGKVLIIDEAYMLYSGSGSDGGGNGADIYKTAVIDTIVAEVQSVPGEDRCVLLLGYEPQMAKIFQNCNSGLTRRFPLSDAFHFEDFSDPELQEILKLKLNDQELGATDRAISVAIDVLRRARNGLNFGNGGDVENLISKAKANYQAHFDPGFDRAAGAETNLQDLFKGVIGCATIIEKLDGYLKVAKGMRAQGLDPRGQIPMNFIFKGPPGTGKTTTARKFGQVYYDLGFLSQVEVIECSATDLIGQYVGQTGPKTIKQLERGLGKVLFVDEAYRLSGGLFAQEAVNELVDTMTKPQFAGKMVIILAGYDKDMNNLLSVNEGLSSRFADEIIFPPLSPKNCLYLLEDKLKQSQIIIPNLQNPDFHQKLLATISELASLPAWGNARDVQALAKSMVREVFKTNTVKSDQLTLSGEKALACIESMLADRRSRQNTKLNPSTQFPGPVQTQDTSREAPFSKFTVSAADLKPQDDQLEEAVQPERPEDPRDAGVSETVWTELQADKKAAELQNQRLEKAIRDKEAQCRLAEQAERKLAAERETAELRALQAKNDIEAFELGRKREEARIRELEARMEKERIQQELDKQREIEMERKKKEQEVQTKLREMGVCPAGFRWIKQSGGYSCAGGSHWVDNGTLGI